MTRPETAIRRALRAALLLIAVSGLACVYAAPATLDEEQAIRKFESLIQAGKYAEVRSELETYTADHPSSWRALYQLGYAYFRLHRIQQSLTALSKSLTLNGRFAESHKILAFDLNILGRPDLAILELQAAIRSDPSSAESHYELGRIYYEQGSYLNALEQLEKARDLAPAFVKVYPNLGLAYSAVGKNSKAIESFEEGLRLNAKQSKPSAWPLIDFATYYNLQGEFEEGKTMLLQAIQIDGSSDQLFDELSKAYRGLGQTSDAIESLKKAVALNPGKAEYHYALARLYTQTHQLAEARTEIAEYEKTHEKSSKAK